MPNSTKPGERPASTTRPQTPPSEPGFASGARGSFIVDSAGTILAFDRGMEELTGWSAYEVLGRSKDLGVYREADESGFRPYRSLPLYEGRLPRNERATRTAVRMTRRDGARLEVEVVATPAPGGGSRAVVEVVNVHSVTLAAESDPSLAGIDALTALPGPRLFEDQLEGLFAAARLGGRTFAVLRVEIDGFRALAERYGKDASNAALCRVAGVLQSSLRHADTVARLDGPNFGILLEGTGRGEARAVGGRIRQVVERFVPEGGDERLTVSIGVACYPADGTSAGEMQRRAEEALGEAHRLGNNRVWCYVRRPRVEVETEVYFDGPAQQKLGTTGNISNSGMFLFTEEEVPVGALLGLTFRLPGQDAPVRVVGRVARAGIVVAGAEERTGVGIEFERYGEPDRQLIESFLHVTHALLEPTLHV